MMCKGGSYRFVEKHGLMVRARGVGCGYVCVKTGTSHRMGIWVIARGQAGTSLSVFVIPVEVSLHQYIIIRESPHPVRIHS